jgi:hypothetical protein
LKNEHKILTSLSVISRTINIALYGETRNDILIDDSRFWKIVESRLRYIKDKEVELGTDLDISQISYSTEMSHLPFLFFEPNGAEHFFELYNSDGSKIFMTGRLISIVSERTNGVRIIRDLNIKEKQSSNS